MKIAFYDTKPYDKIWFVPLSQEYGYEIKFLESRLNIDTVSLAQGADAVCVFVNDHVDKHVINKLCEMNIGCLLLRCAGYNNVDVRAAEGRLKILRVPSYSPSAVAEHAAALYLSVNRKTYRAYLRTRDFNYNINGLMGTGINGKTAGIIGTGKIGRAMINILKGFDMTVIAYDPYPAKDLDVEYVSLDTLMRKSDFISLHCPLTPETRHIINLGNVGLLKPGVIIVNTSRGALIDTTALIKGLKDKIIAGVGLDVYEEEEEYFFEDRSTEIVDDEELALLTTFPNVLITSHQAFFTREAMQEIAMTTMENLWAYENGKELKNAVTG